MWLIYIIYAKWPAALLLLAVLGQTCVSWPIRACLIFKHALIGRLTHAWPSTINNLKALKRLLKTLDCIRKLMLSIKACKHILVITQNKIMNLTPSLLPADEFLAVFFFFWCSTSQTRSKEQKAAESSREAVDNVAWVSLSNSNSDWTMFEHCLKEDGWKAVYLQRSRTSVHIIASH